MIFNYHRVYYRTLKEHC